jgi:hypothetical protein
MFRGPKLYPVKGIQGCIHNFRYIYAPLLQSLTFFCMLNDDFCSFLEYKIGEAFSASGLESVKHFWCDGILLPAFETAYSKKAINDSRQLVLAAYVGPTGQDKYELILKFGPEALSRYARDLDIAECLPDPASQSWWEVDIELRIIYIQLD